MSGGVPADSRDQIAQIVARAYGGSLYPGIGTPGDYPTADVDYRAADAILALPTPTPPIEGRDADVERVRALVEAVEAGKFDEIDAVADQWIEGAGIVRMCNAIASVFEPHAPQEIMDRFRAKLADMMHLAFVEGAAQGTLQARAALQALGERG